VNNIPLDGILFIYSFFHGSLGRFYLVAIVNNAATMYSINLRTSFWYWGLNSGLCTCYVGALALEPSLQPELLLSIPLDRYLEVKLLDHMVILFNSKEFSARHWWLMRIILGPQEAEIRMTCSLKPAQANSSSRPYLKKPFTKIGLVEWLQVKALSSSPNTEKKKKNFL
jgi:hypothetical protein